MTAVTLIEKAVAYSELERKAKQILLEWREDHSEKDTAPTGKDR